MQTRNCAQLLNKIKTYIILHFSAFEYDWNYNHATWLRIAQWSMATNCNKFISSIYIDRAPYILSNTYGWIDSMDLLHDYLSRSDQERDHVTRCNMRRWSEAASIYLLTWKQGRNGLKSAIGAMYFTGNGSRRRFLGVNPSRNGPEMGLGGASEEPNGAVRRAVDAKRGGDAPRGNRWEYLLLRPHQ